MYSETEAPHVPLTRYPRTFHAYFALRQEEDRVQEDSEYFDLVEDNKIFIPQYFTNDVLYLAHDRIIDGEHPYSAWLDTLNIDFENERFIRSLTGMTLTQCESLLGSLRDDAMNVMPEPRLIHLFCNKLGIHPAHLEPGLKDPDFGYDPNVFTAIIDIYLDPHTLEADRALSYRAIQAEIERGKTAFLNAKSQKEPFLVWLEEANTVLSSLRRTKDDFVVSSETGLTEKFSASSFHDVVDGATRLDCLATYFSNLSSGYDSRLKSSQDRRHHAYRQLLEMASLFYGEENEELALQKIFHAVEINRRLPNGTYLYMDKSFWDNVEEDIFEDILYDITGEMRDVLNGARYEIPHFHPNCIHLIAAANKSPADLKDEFMYQLRAYFAFEEQIKNWQWAAQNETRKLERFEEWRSRDAVAQRVILPLFDNMCQLQDRVPQIFNTIHGLLSSQPRPSVV